MINGYLVTYTLSLLKICLTLSFHSLLWGVNNCLLPCPFFRIISIYINSARGSRLQTSSNKSSNLNFEFLRYITPLNSDHSNSTQII